MSGNPYRMHSVRNRVIFLKPLEKERRQLTVSDLPWSKVTWGLIGVGACSVLGGLIIPLVWSGFRPTPVAVTPTPTSPLASNESGSNPLPPISSPSTPAPKTTSIKKVPPKLSDQRQVATVLIPTTKSVQRLSEIPTGRNNPFALAKMTAVLRPLPLDDEAANRAVKKPVKKSLAAPSTPKIAPPPVISQPIPQVAVSPNPTTMPAQTIPIPPQPPNTGIASLPPPPGSSLSPGGLPASSAGPLPPGCQTLEVNGVIQSGGQPMAVIKSPDQPYSRPVRVGDRICSGQVAIQSISGSEDSQPSVVLEQNGTQYIQRVDGNSAV